jgi:hypothetical protein
MKEIFFAKNWRFSHEDIKVLPKGISLAMNGISFANI